MVSMRTVCQTLVIVSILAQLSCSNGIPEGASTRGSMLVLEEDLRLDANTYDFSLVTRVAVSASGYIAVAQPQDFEVRIYDTTGNLVGRAGRRGSGPGEFAHIGALTWLADTLFVNDQRLNRSSYFMPDGTLLRTRSTDFPMAARPLAGAARDYSYRFLIVYSGGADGALHGLATVHADAGEGHHGESVDALITLNGDNEASVITYPPPRHDDRWMLTVDGLSRPVPFMLEPQIAFSPDGMRVAHVSAEQHEPPFRYHVSVFTTTGDTIFSRAYPYEGRPIPRSVMDSAIAAMLPAGGQREGTLSTVRSFQAAARERAPAVYAPIEYLILGDDGRTWLVGPNQDGHAIAIVLDEGGAIADSVRLPDRTRLRHATATELYVTEADEFDLRSVVRYRLRDTRPDGDR